MAAKYSIMMTASVLTSFLLSACNTDQLIKTGHSVATDSLKTETQQSANRPTIDPSSNSGSVDKPESDAAPAQVVQPIHNSLIDTDKPGSLVIKTNTAKGPTEDGIHNPDDPVTAILQHPAEAYSNLPKVKYGNAVDWVKAQESGMINPRSDLYDPEVQPLVMDLDIIREVKGSMLDVIFPHRPHTEVLDCTSCHPGIFIPKKGANKITMTKNLMGQMCGVCHGKVAFSLSRCSACHSQRKKQQKIKKHGWRWP